MDTDFVIVGIQPWHLPLGGNCKDIALELSKTNRVLYVNPPVDRVTAWKNRTNETSRAETLVQISATCWVLTPGIRIESLNWLPDNGLFDWLNRINNRRFARCIRQAIRTLGFTQFNLFNDSDMIRSYYLSDLLKPRQFIYYTRDNLLTVDYWKRHGQRLEPALMRKASLVVSNSAYLARLASQYNPNTFDIGQGCNLTQFDASVSHPVPADLQPIAFPKIGYIGALNASRLNISWLLALATSRPDWNLVLVGPEDDAFRLSALHGLSNVHFLGSKPMADLPAYLQHLDVAINPQQLNDLTIGNYPRKVDEYLAMGKPVVALDTETMQLFADYVRLAKTFGQFMDGIDKALASEMPASPEAGIDFARSHTWGQSVAKLMQAIRSVTMLNTLTETFQNDDCVRLTSK
jgi:teichuronic acid biosynthesis glycosyltransferase TuaH